MYFRKSLSGFLALALIAQYLVLIPQGAHAIDGDGSNNINLVLTPTLPSSTIIGKNFTLDIALANQSSSEGDAYRPGVILSLPTGVSLVSAGVLGTPTRTVTHASGTTLLFFQTKNDVILDGLTVHYPITLASSNAAGVFVSRDIGVLAYVDDSIYGRGAVPTGAPPATLPGGVDWASGSGVSMPDTTDLTFPAAVSSATNLSTLPFIKPTTEFTPFDVTKEESTMNLIGKTVTTTLKIHGNSMGALRHFHLQDVIPMNRAFSGFVTPVGGNIGGLDITYDSPSPGLATLDITDVTVPTGTDISIVYETLPLAYDMSSYSGSTPVLDSGSVIPHHDLSRNTVTMHTGALALVGGPYPTTTWNNGTSDIAVNSSSMLPPRSVDTYNRYANLAKSVNVSQAVIGQTVTYTLSLSTAKNAAFTTNGSGTYITDILPDGMTYSGEVSSTLSGIGTPLTFISSSTNADGDTTLTWRLNSGVIGADATATILYQAVVDGAYEGAGDTQYENTETLVNSASFYGTVGDGGLSGEWGASDASIIDTTVSIMNVTATISAPTPTTKKHLVSITTPTGSVYDWSTGLPTSVPAGSHLRFAVTMDFPEVDFLSPKVIDALPLLAGPNTSAYDFAFQTGTGLKDIYNTGILFNTEDGTTPASTFNTLALAGTTYPNAAWIQATGANNLEFALGNGRGKKTFAIMFSVDVLAQKPAGGVPTTGLIPLTNFAYSSFNDDTAVPNPLPIMDIPFDVNFPSVTVTKVASGTTNIETAKPIDYTITLTNTGSAPAFLENIIDTLPVNMTLLSGSIMASGGVVGLTNSAITQVGTGLFIAFSTGGAAGVRSLIPLDDTGTPTIRENIITIRYILTPDTSFVIQGGATRTNTVALDYYASSGAVSNGVNNLGHLTASANVIVKSPTLSRSVYATSETDSTTNNLYVGEEVTYRTIITVPQGTLNTATYSETNNANLTFLSGSVVSYSGSLTFSTGTAFSGVTVPFGTIVNTDTDTATLETIIIDTIYRVNKSATAGTNYSDNGTFSYSSTSTASAVNVNVRKPTLTLTKTATPTIGQHGTTVNYTVTLNNTSTTARAYDVLIRDILPSKLQYITGSLVVGAFSGTENELFTTGLALDMLMTSSGQSFTFQATPTTDVAPNETLTNNVSGTYDTLDDDNSLYEWTGALSGNANFGINDISIIHTVIATDLGDTTSILFSGALSDVAIGERVTYDTVIAVPQSTFTGFTITETLPVGMKFLSGIILIDGIKSHTLSNITITPDNVITFSLGDVDNTGIGAGSGVTLRTEAVLQNTGANLAGTVKNSNVTVSYGVSSRNAGPAAIDVVEPSLAVTKVYAPNTGDAGDTLPTTVTVQNIGSVTAYDVVLTDIIAGKTTPDGGYSGSISIGTLAPGETRTYNYNSVIATNVTAGEILTGTSSILYTSYPGTPVEGERSYSAVDIDYINIINSGAIVINRTSPEATKIGDTVHYQIIVPVSEGNTANLTLTNTIPTGMALIPGSITITESGALSYSGTVTPVISPDSDSILAGQTQVATYAFTDIVNTDVDNGNTETIIIEYDAVVMNSVDTNNGNTKTHTVTANYNSGAIIKNGTSLPITLIEPHLILSVSNSYTDGFTVPYTFTLTNSGTATAYDIDLTTLLPMLVSYTGTLSITNSGGAVGLTQVGNDFTITSLPVNMGNPLVFTLLGAIDESATNGSIHTLTGTVTYTSEAGIYTSTTLNILNTERTSGGGVNDYIDANKSTVFTLMLSLLDESISVLDVNGGAGIIGDVFTYTITLTNTGSVPLSGIPVTLDIPSGFTGFTMISLPVGSSDISTMTGGAHGAGYLSVTGISIPVGQSRTIVYEVTALTSVIPGTIIPTTATVGDSIEGARGGYPSVPVQIDAPRLVSTALEVDTNGTPLYNKDSIHHIFTLTNSGTATGTNLSVTLAWNTGSVFTGSVIFQTGTLIDTGSVIIDSVNNIITFTIPTLPVGHTETIELDSRADGPVGTTITSQIQATAVEGVSTDTLSNTLIIVNYAPLVGGGGGGGGGGNPPGTPVPSNPPLTSITPVETPRITKTKIPKKSIENNISLPKTPLDALYGEYLEKMAQYQKIVQDENTSGVLGIQYPKILPQTGKNILDRVKKFFNAKLSVDAPTFALGGETLTSYLQNLPAVDRNRDEYIVLPSNGMITPINTVASGSTDYTKLVNGREINVNNHLKDGVLVYPGTNNAGYAAVGNTVIFGHSSYYASDSGRYKTHFQKIIELEVGEEIWVYKKLSSGEYEKYRYIVEASYDTPAKDTSILAPGIGKNLTLFTCTPIGGITGRWTVKAKYIDEEKVFLTDLLFGKSLTSPERKEIQNYFQSIKMLALEEKKANLSKKFEEVSLRKKSVSTRYFLFQLAKSYKTIK